MADTRNYTGSEVAVKLSVSVELNLKTAEVTKAVKEAARLAMRDTAAAIAADAQKLTPKDTGNNLRSIKYEASGMPVRGDIERIVDDNKIEGAVYSTSGYGGYLETGHHTKSGSWVAARPYMKPALDLSFTLEKFTEDMKRHLK